MSTTTDSTSRPALRKIVDEPNKHIWHGSCLDAPSVIERSSLALVVTSPPYPGVDQPEDEYATFPSVKDFNECHDFLQEVWKVCYDLLADEGRLVINIYDIPFGPEGMFPNVAGVIKRALDVGFVLRETYIWKKGASYSPPSGSFPDPKGVLSANTYEPCILLQKPLQFRQRKQKPADVPKEARAASQLGPVEHKWLMDPVWDIPAEREGRKMGHPFTFPETLVERFIKLYTYVGEGVFDPFLGSGTTVLSAAKQGRIGYGTELSDKYAGLMDQRFLGQPDLFG